MDFSALHHGHSVIKVEVALAAIIAAKATSTDIKKRRLLNSNNVLFRTDNETTVSYILLSN